MNRKECDRKLSWSKLRFRISNYWDALSKHTKTSVQRRERVQAGCNGKGKYGW